MEVDSQAPSALEKLKLADPERYGRMEFMPAPLCSEFQKTIPFATDLTKEALRDSYAAFKTGWWPATQQSPEIITAASYALRSGSLGLKATRIVLSGLSQTGGLTRRFITHSAPYLRLPDGSIPFEGYIPCQSGGEVLPDVPGAKIIELLGEAEFQSVRLPCGISGQMKEVEHRRPDSDGFRVYEVAGMAHRESRWASPRELERWSVVDLRGAEWSTFANSFIYHAVFELVERWTGKLSVAPPPSMLLQTIDDTDEILRDEHGNALGGVRTVHSESPISRLVACTPKGRPAWYWGKFLSRLSPWPESLQCGI